ncbi:hypothetical protein BU17DRAFT_74219 [Hysterangium stoloniferum]|nr:hypothetical protein BU17DRAFT_74219 [Hysterangium stoloniferum]
MRTALLRCAFPLVKTHGFTRQTLSLAALALPDSPHSEPLSEFAVSALFGPGLEARRTLINAWLDEGIEQMGGDAIQSGDMSVRDALKGRLKWNEPVLEKLPEAFAVLSTVDTPIPFPIHVTPALAHVAKVAHQACVLSGDTSVGTSWYARRASVAAVYAAAELHQLTSPTSAYQFLESLLESSASAGDVISDVGQYADYIWRSWRAIGKSKGLL